MPTKTLTAALIGLIVSVIILLFQGILLSSFSSQILVALGTTSLSLGLLSLAFVLFKRLRTYAGLVLLLNMVFLVTAVAYGLSRAQFAVYPTDSMVASHGGAEEIAEGRNPYRSSLLPFLERAGLPPSFYTPRVDGTVEARFVYPSLNFLLFAPLIALGIGDIRPIVFAFNGLATVLIYLGVRKPLNSVGVFMLYLPFILNYQAQGLSDIVWASFLLASSLVWYSNRKLSLVFVGFALAYKQVAWAVAPFVLVRLWREEGISFTRSKLKAFAKTVFIPLGTFLIINLPFLFEAPSEWWSSTVGPFLPLGPGMVIGGEGLVYFARAFSWTLPHAFFSLASVVVMATVVAVYFLNFERLKWFMWLLPMIPFFFFTRSLSNYFLFWPIPFTVDLMRMMPRLPQQLHALPRFKLGLPRISTLTRRALASALIVISCTGLIVSSGIYFANSSNSLTSNVIVLPPDPPLDIPAVTKLQVVVENKFLSAITPRFFVSWSSLPYYWLIDEGPKFLPSRSNATYSIRSQDLNSAIPVGQQFVILVYDAESSQLVGLSERLVLRTSQLPILNGNFSWWTLDLSSGRWSPYGWTVKVQGGPGDNQTLTRVDQSEVTSLAVSIYQDGVAPENFVRASISQVIGFPNELSIVAMIPQSAIHFFEAGVKISDGEHTLFYIFGEETVPTRESSPLNQTLFINLNSTEWVKHTFTLQKQWTDLGWLAPSRVTIEFFIQTSSVNEGFFTLYLAQVSAATRQGSVS